MPRSTDIRSPAGQARIAALALAAVVGGCVPSGQMAGERASMPIFDPIAFFAGRTEGRGELKIITRHLQSTLVEGSGVVQPNGSILLDQDVRRGGGTAKHRAWRLQRVAAGRYAGTLTDAVGPVAGQVSGNRLHLAFAMKGGLQAQQWLYLAPGGQIAHNRMIVSRLGIVVASLDETIRRLPPR